MALPRKRRSIKFWLPLFGAFALYFLLVYWAGSSLCLVRAMTGLPCPGCGLTHAAIAVAHGDLSAAAQANVMIFLVPLVVALFIFDRWRSRSDSCHRFCNKFYIAIASVMVIYFFVRVVIYFPHGPYPMIWSKNNIPNKIVSVIRDLCTNRFSQPVDR